MKYIRLLIKKDESTLIAIGSIILGLVYFGVFGIIRYISDN
ncbi:MAG TPA: hypothetical protein PLA06_08950 [Syntrophorhabdaceae bacterium]|jgi:capsule polysaccharide export protein KpsE/RkpR|nr:hypothetical protein [Pseudomonadota bacterium]HQP52289.1 hypothetical protein [Syntrophorhabdaceae bacterium]